MYIVQLTKKKHACANVHMLANIHRKVRVRVPAALIHFIILENSNDIMLFRFILYIETRMTRPTTRLADFIKSLSNVCASLHHRWFTFSVKRLVHEYRSIELALDTVSTPLSHNRLTKGSFTLSKEHYVTNLKSTKTVVLAREGKSLNVYLHSLLLSRLPPAPWSSPHLSSLCHAMKN